MVCAIASGIWNATSNKCQKGVPGPEEETALLNFDSTEEIVSISGAVLGIIENISKSKDSNETLEYKVCC